MIAPVSSREITARGCVAAYFDFSIAWLLRFQILPAQDFRRGVVGLRRCVEPGCQEPAQLRNVVRRQRANIASHGHLAGEVFPVTLRINVTSVYHNDPRSRMRALHEPGSSHAPAYRGNITATVGWRNDHAPGFCSFRSPTPSDLLVCSRLRTRSRSTPEGRVSF